jgi:Rrf2 family transcriptional regulator, nitric oxide-sensitive transcriptional repressor
MQEKGKRGATKSVYDLHQLQRHSAQLLCKKVDLSGKFGMRLTTRTNLAMRTLMFCAVNPDRIVRKHEVAEACGASENHLAQVIHLLARKGYIKTQRGRSGGLMLARGPEKIGVGEVFRAFEAVLPFTECTEEKQASCPLATCCRLKCVLQEALDAFYARLDRSTLADLVAENTELETLLKVA